MDGPDVDRVRRLAYDPMKVLHLLSQRPLRTGSGVTLDATVRLAQQAGWEQQVVVGVVSSDEELEQIKQVVDMLITKHVGENGELDESTCDAINEALRKLFEQGNISTPAQVSLSYGDDSTPQLGIDLGLPKSPSSEPSE